MKLRRMLEILGKPIGLRVVLSTGRDGKRTSGSMLTWICAEEPCEPVCVARNPVVFVDLPMSKIPDNGLWTLESCPRHATLFENDDDL